MALQELDWLRLTPRLPEEANHPAAELARAVISKRLESTMLAEAALLSPELSPSAFCAVSESCARLKIPTPVVFVHPSRELNACCFAREREDLEDVLIICLNSGLIREFDQDALKFVIGHELGHYILERGVQKGMLKSGREHRFASSIDIRRFSELNADRVGLLCVDRVESALDGMMQMASGLRVNSGAKAGQALLEQLRALEQNPLAPLYLESQHPPIPLRARNIQLFSMTGEYCNKSGRAEGHFSLEACNSAVLHSYWKIFAHDGDHASDFHRAKFWAVLLLFGSNGKLTHLEQDCLTEFFGEERKDAAIRFLSHHANTARQAVASKLKSVLHSGDLRGPQKFQTLVDFLTTCARKTDQELPSLRDAIDELSSSMLVE